MYLTAPNLVQLVQKRSQEQAEQLAYIFLEDGKTATATLTYGQLHQQVCQLAQYLKTFTNQGDRLLLVYPAGLDFVVAFLGCLTAGVVAVPVYPPRPNRSLDYLQLLAQDAQAIAVLSTESMLSKLQPKLQEQPDLKQLRWFVTDTLEALNDTLETPTIEPNNTLAFLQYTSGSTGEPKGVMVSHGNLIHNLQTIQAAFELTPASISVSWLPHYHDMGLVDGILEPLYTGYLGVLMPPTAFLQQPIRWLEAISHYRGTHSGGPDVGYDLCCRKITLEQQQTLDLSCWVSAYNGAEPIRAETLQAFTEKFASNGFQEKYFYPCYGMAESTLMISGVAVSEKPRLLTVSAKALEQNQVVLAVGDQDATKQLVGCGQTRLQTQLKIIDPETLQPCAEDRIGEIWVSGESIAQGYWQKPEITAASFNVPLGEARFFRTGDLGFVHQGEVFITGRLKDIVIIWGRNYYPQDLEFTVANCHPALGSGGGAAFSVTEFGAEQLVIVQEIERTARRDLDLDGIVVAIREAIATEYDLQVQAIALIKPASIPKTSSGKIQRRTCRQMFLEQTLDPIAEWRQPMQTDTSSNNPSVPDVDTASITATTIQDWLIQRLAQALNLAPDEIDLDESFAQYGLDSSVMLEITGDLGEWLHYKAEPTLLWEYTDITSLAEYLIGEIDVD